MAIKFSHLVIFIIYVVFHSNLADQICASSENIKFLHNLDGGHKGVNIEGIAKLKKHLDDLGYIRSADSRNMNSSNIFDDSLESALKKYQSFYNLNVTGVIDHDTISLMSKPRCGVPDFPMETLNHEFYNYSFFPGKSKRGTFHLSYQIAKGIGGEHRLMMIKEALDEWSQESMFEFNYVNNATADSPNHLTFEFGEIDGEGNTLAYAASSPGSTGDAAHFDIAEQWADGAVRGGKFDLRSVALHEIGHLLGLAHTSDKNSIMYAYMSPNTVKYVQIGESSGLANLYGYGFM